MTEQKVPVTEKYSSIVAIFCSDVAEYLLVVKVNDRMFIRIVICCNIMINCGYKTKKGVLT